MVHKRPIHLPHRLPRFIKVTTTGFLGSGKYYKDEAKGIEPENAKKPPWNH
jgi:hypothetical protein